MFRIYLAISILFYSVFSFANESKVQVFEVKVTESGFSPNVIHASPGNKVILKITRATNTTCATQIQIPIQNLKKELPLNQTVTLDLGRLEKGHISFGCGMSMMEGGRINVL